MQTIKQTVDVNFNAIDFKDALIIAPIIDELINRYRSAHSALDEAYNKGKRQYNVGANLKSLRETYSQLQVLLRLGFQSTLPDDSFKESKYLNLSEEQIYERITELMSKK